MLTPSDFPGSDKENYAKHSANTMKSGKAGSKTKQVCIDFTSEPPPSLNVKEVKVNKNDNVNIKALN